MLESFPAAYLITIHASPKFAELRKIRYNYTEID